MEDSLAEQDNAMAAMSEKIRQREEEIVSLRAKLQQESRQFSVDKDRYVYLVVSLKSSKSRLRHESRQFSVDKDRYV